MINFRSAREAKEFLAARIADQAERDGIILSAVERKMLYFSETAWTLPDMIEVNEAFERNYDQTEYEKKIATLIGNARSRAWREDRVESGAWPAAIKMLSREDHYLTVMIQQSNSLVRPPGDLLKLWGTGVAICLTFATLAVFWSHC